MKRSFLRDHHQWVTHYLPPVFGYYQFAVTSTVSNMACEMGSTTDFFRLEISWPLASEPQLRMARLETY
jgi:hypothetical protein